jgi:hypothetical protein
MLVQALAAATRQLQALAALAQQSATQPIRIEANLTGGGDDRTEADAIKRGQRPEQVAAIRKALGL